MRPLGWSRTPGRSWPGPVTAHTSGPGGRPADGEVGLERGPAAAGEGDDALLVALAVANQQAAAGEVAVGQVERAQLGAADAGVEEEQHHGGIAPPDGGGGIARRHQARELGGAEGLYELGREADVAQAAETACGRGSRRPRTS